MCCVKITYDEDEDEPVVAMIRALVVERWVGELVRNLMFRLLMQVS